MTRGLTTQFRDDIWRSLQLPQKPLFSDLLYLLSSKVTMTVNHFSKTSLNFQSTRVNRSEVGINKLSSDFACDESLIFVRFSFFYEQPELFSSFLQFFLFLSPSFPSLLAQGSVLNEIESNRLCRMWLCFSAGSWENSPLGLQKSVGHAVFSASENE